MVKVGVAIAAACLLVACSRPAPQPAPAQSGPIPVSEHPQRAKFVGVWHTDERPVLRIQADAEGGVTIAHIATPEEAAVWEHSMENVHWEGDSLCFDEYYFYTGDADLSSPANPGGGHPFSGVRNSMSLQLTDDPAVLLFAYNDESMPEELRVPEKLFRVQADD